MSNIQKRRTFFADMKRIVQQSFPKSKIHIGNHGFVVVPFDAEKGVYKIFYEKLQAEREEQFYTLLSSHEIIVPKITQHYEIVLRDTQFWVTTLENIRYFPKYEYIEDIPGAIFVQLLDKIHTIKDTEGDILIHANIHASNIFLNHSGELGIFDLGGMMYSQREYDYAQMYVQTLCDENYFRNLVKNSIYRENFSYTLFYGYVLGILLQSYKNNTPIREEGIQGLKKNIEKTRLLLQRLM